MGDACVVPRHSPVTETLISRWCDAVRCSKMKMPCHIPSVMPPAAMGIGLARAREHHAGVERSGYRRVQSKYSCGHRA